MPDRIPIHDLSGRYQDVQSAVWRAIAWNMASTDGHYGDRLEAAATAAVTVVAPILAERDSLRAEWRDSDAGHRRARAELKEAREEIDQLRTDCRGARERADLNQREALRAIGALEACRRDRDAVTGEATADAPTEPASGLAREATRQVPLGQDATLSPAPKARRQSYRARCNCCCTSPCPT